MLDPDGYDAFTEAGTLRRSVAQRLREFIYSSGNSREPREAYRAFRAATRSVQPIAAERGLLEAQPAGLTQRAASGAEARCLPCWSSTCTLR